MFEQFRSSHINKNLIVTVDNGIYDYLSRIGFKIAPKTSILVSINLEKLIIAMGTLDLIRTKPATNRQRFVDKARFLQRINENTIEFRIIRSADIETQQEISEEFGKGLSALVADSLFNLKYSTLTRIPRNTRASKPDIQALSRNNDLIVWEAKGSINPFPPLRIRHAIDQKNTVLADFGFVSLSKLNQNSICMVNLIDPPHEDSNLNDSKKLVLKADHYSSLFNFIGQGELSKYFSLMRKRILHETRFPDFSIKEYMYEKIKKDYVRIERNQKTFLGNVEGLGEGEYIFIGVDRELISLQGFRNFQDYEQDIYWEEGTNLFTITKDGLCIGLLSNINFLSAQLEGKIIPHFQDATTVRDIDIMDHYSIMMFISYLFIKIGAEVINQMNVKGFSADLVVNYKKKKFIVEFKKIVNKESVDFLINKQKEVEPHKFILITPQKIKRNLMFHAIKDDIILIERRDLKDILRNHKYIVEFME